MKALRADNSDDLKCEGCTAPATGEDSEGVPLCNFCLFLLEEESRKENDEKIKRSAQ